MLFEIRFIGASLRSFQLMNNIFWAKETQSWFFFLRFLYQNKKGSGFQGNALKLINIGNLESLGVVAVGFTFNFLTDNFTTNPYALHATH